MDEKNLAVLRQLKEQLLAEEPKPEVIYPFKTSASVKKKPNSSQSNFHDLKAESKKESNEHADILKNSTSSKKIRKGLMEKRRNYRTAQETQNAELLKKSKQARKEKETPIAHKKDHYGWYNMMHDAQDHEPHYEPHTYSGGMVRPK